MQHMEVAIMDQLKRPGKYLIAGSIGPPFLETPINSSPPVKNAKKLEWPLAKGMRCPQQPILFCEVFDVWGIDFMGPFLVSNDYVSRWVEAIATKTNDAKVVVDFLKSNIFCQFGVPKVLISDQVELKDESTNNTFQVNGHQIKLFHEGPTPIAGDMETITLMEPALPDDTP
ncbi:hypothetical protein CR513_31768, partial [Mucuna pruriens]